MLVLDHAREQNAEVGLLVRRSPSAKYECHLSHFIDNEHLIFDGHEVERYGSWKEADDRRIALSRGLHLAPDQHAAGLRVPW
jgi:hypothetical protein